MMLPVVEIIRIEENHDHGTFGVMKLNKEAFCLTLELRDEENARNLSSIPAQQYFCTRYSSVHFPNTFQVQDVPNRSSILFHAGNTVDDTAGCILIGSSFDKFKTGDRCILNSGLTFKRFMNALVGYDRFVLTIKEDF